MHISLLQRLKEKKYQVKYVTNTTKESRSRLLSRLNKLDLNIVKEDIFSSLSVTNEYIRSKSMWHGSINAQITWHLSIISWPKVNSSAHPCTSLVRFEANFSRG